jgi:putative transposase
MVLQAYRFALDPTASQGRALASHCGGARKAFNEGLAQVKRCLDQRDAERSYGVPEEQLTEVPWSLSALRRWWNQVKDEQAPWWRENSKEAYNSGLEALVRGLRAWSDSRSGKRHGPKVAFPKFNTRHRARSSCRFTTGAIRIDDRSHVVLPRIGRIKVHEPTTALLDKINARQARILAATVSFDGRRWYCSFTVEAGRALCRPSRVRADPAHPVVGVDVGVRDLVVVAAPSGIQVARVRAPRSLARAQAGCARYSAALLGRSARTDAAGSALRGGGAGRQCGSGGSTPGPQTSAGMCCTKPPHNWPSAIRSSLSRTSPWRT